MTTFLANILLALAWMALTGQFIPINFVVGFGLGYVILWLVHRTASSSIYATQASQESHVHDSLKYFIKAPQVIRFIFYFIWELIKANLQVAYEIITPNYSMRPGVIAIPLDIKTDAEITLLANLITLTPGTLSLDVSDDQQTLYIHAMYVDDLETFRRSIKDGFEKRVQEIFQ